MNRNASLRVFTSFIVFSVVILCNSAYAYEAFWNIHINQAVEVKSYPGMDSIVGHTELFSFSAGQQPLEIWGLMQILTPTTATGDPPILTKATVDLLFLKPTNYPDMASSPPSSAQVGLYAVPQDDWSTLTPWLGTDAPKYIPPFEGMTLLDTRLISLDDNNDWQTITFDLMNTGLYQGTQWAQDWTDDHISLALRILPGQSDSAPYLWWGTPTGTPVHLSMTRDEPLATPEPSTMLLMGIGAAGIAFVKRRKAKAIM